MRGYVRGGVTGEPYAQVDNPDPFAAAARAVLRAVACDRLHRP